MIKILLLLILATSAIDSNGQFIEMARNPDTKLIEFDTILTFKDITKNKLQSLLTLWVAKDYKSANAVIQMNDKENGILVIKGIYADVNYGALMLFSIGHTITIDFKDNKIKVHYTDFTCMNASNNSTPFSYSLERILYDNPPPGFGKKKKENLKNEIMDRVNNQLTAISITVKQNMKQDW